MSMCPAWPLKSKPMEGRMSRTAAREVAVRLCYSAELSGDWSPARAVDFFESEYYATLCGEDDLFCKEPDAEQLAYIGTLFAAVAEHKDETDGYIAKYAKGWTLPRISRISLAILRCAVCEMLYLNDATSAVAINEAVEIAKHYEEPETVSFINGVLSSFVRGELENP